jgi:Ca2+-binding EF-hand superfamily protein
MLKSVGEGRTEEDMTRKTALLAGGAVVAGWVALTAMALAQGASPDATHKPGERHGFGHGGILTQFDLNKDGTVTKAEFDKALAERFSKATNGATSMTEAQFAAIGKDRMQRFDDAMFKRIDWNGDGHIDLTEFTTAQHALFLRADRDGSGVINCAPRERAMHKDGEAGKSAEKADAGKMRHGHFMRHRGGMMGARMLCQTAGVKDGKLTRVAFDQAIKVQFNAKASNGVLSPDAFASMVSDRMAQGKAKAFARLDTNHDGKLTLAEFSAPQQKMFERLDRNKDGQITKDELSRGHWRGHDQKPGMEKNPG